MFSSLFTFVLRENNLSRLDWYTTISMNQVQRLKTLQTKCQEFKLLLFKPLSDEDMIKISSVSLSKLITCNCGLPMKFTGFIYAEETSVQF